MRNGCLALPRTSPTYWSMRTCKGARGDDQGLSQHTYRVDNTGYDFRITLPDADRHRTLRGPREARKQIYEAEIFEIECRVATLGVLPEETEFRRSECVA